MLRSTSEQAIYTRINYIIIPTFSLLLHKLQTGHKNDNPSIKVDNNDYIIFTAVSYLSSFGGGNGSTLIDNADCIGDELRLEDCLHNGVGKQDCNDDHTEDAGVICDPGLYINKTVVYTVYIAAILIFVLCMDIH